MSLPPSLEETRKAIKQIQPNKASNPDNIPSELIQHGGDCLLSQIHLVFLSIRETKDVPRDLLDASFMTIFKKGNRSACQGSSLLWSLWRFLPGCFTNASMSSAKQLSQSQSTVFNQEVEPQRWEKVREQQQAMIMILFDLYKAFVSFPGATLLRAWEVPLPPTFCPTSAGSTRWNDSAIHGACVLTSFPIATGVRQGSIYLAAVLLRVNMSHDPNPALWVRVLDSLQKEHSGPGEVSPAKAASNPGNCLGRMHHKQLCSNPCRPPNYRSVHGHLRRSVDSSLPKQTLCCKLANDSRMPRAPERWLNDQLKQVLKKSRTPVDNWEALAADRTPWGWTIAKGVQKLETDSAQAAEAKRQQRH